MSSPGNPSYANRRPGPFGTPIPGQLPTDLGLSGNNATGLTPFGPNAPAGFAGSPVANWMTEARAATPPTSDVPWVVPGIHMAGPNSFLTAPQIPQGFAGSPVANWRTTDTSDPLLQLGGKDKTAHLAKQAAKEQARAARDAGRLAASTGTL